MFNPETHPWGGSGIEKELFRFIEDNFFRGIRVVEFGGGYGSTPALASLYELYTVEENPSFISGDVNTTWIHAPIKNGWYDLDVLKEKLPKEFDLLFIDGPAGSGNRDGILDNLNLIPENCKIILHDTYRPAEINLSIKLAELLNKEPVFHHDNDFWCLIE